MAEMKHTPGPWTVEDPMGADIGLSIVQSGLETYEWEFIAIISRSDWVDGAHMGRQHFISPEEQTANARLIAAAPELLALAYQYRDDLHHPPTPGSRERRLSAIEAVLSKAGA